MAPSVQLNLPPAEVQKVNQPSRMVNYATDGRLTPTIAPVKRVNLLRITREAIKRAHLSQTWFASALGISEPLVSAQLSDHAEDKHLSMRRMGRIDEAGFWREFLMLLAEDIGLTVVVLDAEQKQALTNLQTASAEWARVSVR